MATARSRTRAGSASVGRIPLLLVCLLLLLVAFSSITRAPPPVPMTTQGNAYDRTGAPLAVGMPIRTMIDGVDYSNGSVVQTAQGAYSVLTAGNLVINATTPEPSPTKQGANLGEAVLYAAGDFATQVDTFQEVLPWHPNTTVTQDLHLGSAPTTPVALRIQGLVTQPAAGGDQYVFLCNPSPSPVPLSDYYLQVDRPGTYYGGNLTLTGAVPASADARVNLTSAFPLIPTGDALKLVYRNPGGAGASAGGRDVVIDRVEFNATSGGTLFWQPGSTILGSAPAPGPGQILERTPACTPARGPGAFALHREPGLPAAGAPIVTVSAPTPGQIVQGGQTFTIRWTMTDPVFVPKYLRVWVNVTVRGTTTPLLAGVDGPTSAEWSVPDMSASDARVHVDVIDPFAMGGNATSTFTIAPATPFAVYVAILVIVVVAVFILLAFYYARRQPRPSSQPPPAKEPPVTPPPAAAGAPASPTPAPGSGTRVCPRCQTVVKEADDTCFFCGYLFVKPPP